MNKIIITADIHLACYTQYNLLGDPEFRDKQFIRFANRLIDVAKENDTKLLIIAGDIIDRPLISSNEIHLLSCFVETLSEYFTDIYYINGNHDLAHRQDTVEYVDSIVNMFDRFGKMHYMHNKSINILGKSFYFRDYIHGDIPPCPDGTDVFIGHITIGGGPLKGQKFLDLNSFKICIAGDIHKPVDVKNVHSVGCPLQKSLSDPPNGTIGILDVDTLEFSRVQVANDKYKFLRIYRAGEEESPDDYTKIIDRVDKIDSIVINGNRGEKLNISINNINDVIDKSTSEYADIHQQFKLKVPSVDPVDLSFDLKRIKIRNFKSIKEFDFSFDENKGQKRIYGKNGSGKSAIVNALKVALVGDKRIKLLQKSDQDEKLYLELELEYQGVLYKIERTIGKTQFYINGEKSNGSGKKDTEDIIYKSLPFLNFIDLFFISHSVKFFDKFKESNLLDNLFGLSSLGEYKRLAEEEILKNKRDKKLLEELVSRKSGSIDVISSELEETRKMISTYDVSDLDYESSKGKISEITDLQNLLSVSIGNLKYQKENLKEDNNPYKKHDNINDIISKGKYYKECLILKEEIAKKQEQVELMKRKIESSKIKCLNCGAVQNESEISKMEKSLSLLESELNSVKEKDNNTLSVEVLEKEIKELREIYDENLRYEQYEKSKSSSKDIIDELTNKIKERESKISDLINGFKNVEDAIEFHKSVIQKFNNKNALLDTLDRQAKKEKELKNELLEANMQVCEKNNEINRLSNYKRIFDNESDESIYKKIIEVISNALSDDEIKFQLEDGELVFLIKVGNLWIDFDNASEGQKSLMDLLFLQKMMQLIPSIGLLVFDEVGASLDSSKWSRLSQIISEFNPRDLFVVSHSELFSGVGKGIEATLENNSSRYKIV